jgi:hypothetical protein
MLFLRLHGQGFVVAEIFWGLWLFPLARLVYKSRFLPRFVGVWLALAGFAWVILSITGILLPQYQGEVSTYSQPAFFGEIALMLWLSIKSAKPQDHRSLVAQQQLRLDVCLTNSGGKPRAASREIVWVGETSLCHISFLRSAF